MPAAPGRFLMWPQRPADTCGTWRRAGLSYRNYGFFVTDGITRDGKVIIPDNYPAGAGLQPGGHDLDGLTDVDFRRFDLDYPDSDAPAHFVAGVPRACLSVENDRLWQGPDLLPHRRMETGIRADAGTRPVRGRGAPSDDRAPGHGPHLRHSSGKPTPRAMVADNDFAVGELVEAVSHSPIWLSTAIVIIEDDAQNGPDHIDAHRSTCYLISPWMKRGPHGSFVSEHGQRDPHN